MMSSLPLSSRPHPARLLKRTLSVSSSSSSRSSIEDLEDDQSSRAQALNESAREEVYDSEGEVDRDDEDEGYDSDEDSAPLVHPRTRSLHPSEMETEPVIKIENPESVPNAPPAAAHNAADSSFDQGGPASQEMDVEDLMARGNHTSFEKLVETGRKQQALSFIQSLPLLLLSQTLVSVKAEGRRLKGLLAGTPGVVLLEEEEELDEKQELMALDSDDEEEGQGIKIPLIDRSTGKPKPLRFPSNPNPNSKSRMHNPAARNLACMMRVAELMGEGIKEGVVVTKRDIFYRDVQLFKKQAVVDEWVDTLVASARLKRADFNICASAKGLIATDCLSITLKSGHEISLSSRSGTLIPPESNILRIEKKDGKDVGWVLIVEKDAVFQSLCEKKFAEDEVLGSGVIITGKGFPDLSTIQLCSLLAMKFPQTPFAALVDADPSGLSILSTYTFGSSKSKHAEEMCGLPLGARLKWLGVKVTEWAGLGLNKGMEGLLELTDRDRKLAQSMLLNRPDMPDEWRRELSHMLHLQRKAEIQILSQSSALGTSNGDGSQPTSQSGSVGHVSNLVQYLRQKISAL